MYDVDMSAGQRGDTVEQNERWELGAAESRNNREGHVVSVAGSPVPLSHCHRHAALRTRNEKGYIWSFFPTPLLWVAVLDLLMS